MIMRFVITLLTCFFFCFGCSAQKAIYIARIDSLKTIREMPYYPELSGDDLFWNLTISKSEIVPYLINRIVDTTKTDANIPNFGGVYTVGDICVRAIEEIIKDFKIIELIERDSEKINEKAYGVYWEYVRGNFRNRVELQKRVKLWYNENKKYLLWQDDSQLYATSDDENAVIKKRPAGGYYLIRKR